MKLFVLALAAAGLAVAQQSAATKTAAAKPAMKKAAVESVTLPVNAKQVGEGVWEHTDAAGKQWVYKKLPFGLAKFSKAEFEARSAGANAVPPELTVVEENGAYKFSRRTPFGAVTYVKKTEDLNETERAVVAAASRNKAK